MFFAALVIFVRRIPFGDFDTIVGDNIAQVAYFRVLFRSNLIGSIGASSMKPGLILLLGCTHDLSLKLFGSTVLIKLLFAIFAAGLVTIVARIAKDAAGALAGVLAAVYLVTQTPVPGMYTTGSSMIVFLPLLFGGIWLWARGHVRAAAVVLCFSALIRIEAFAVLAWLCASEQLLRRDLRAVMFTSTVTALTLVLTALVYYRLQGSVSRFNAGGPAVGYVFSRDPSLAHRLTQSLAYTLSASYQTLGLLIVPAAIGIFVNPSRRIYASLLGVPVFLNVYIASASGSAELRYFEFLVPAGACFGAAGLFAAVSWGRSAFSRAHAYAAAALGGLAVSAFLLGERELAYSALLTLVSAGAGVVDELALKRISPRIAPAALALLLVTAGSVAVFRGNWQREVGRATYTQDARRLLSSLKLLRGSRVLTEDDVIYSVIVRDPDFFVHATALQYFNIQDDEVRKEILDATDYVAVSRGRHSWYYLRNDPYRRGNTDPFRAALADEKDATLYGYRLKLVEKSAAWRVFKVQPSHPHPHPHRHRRRGHVLGAHSALRRRDGTGSGASEAKAAEKADLTAVGVSAFAH